METIKEEIIKEVVNNLDDVKLDDCLSQDLFILVVSDTTKFIDFIGVDRFDIIISSYLVNLYNYTKSKKKKFKLICLSH